jgi:hypothetical protein
MYTNAFPPLLVPCVRAVCSRSKTILKTSVSSGFEDLPPTEVYKELMVCSRCFELNQLPPRTRRSNFEKIVEGQRYMCGVVCGGVVVVFRGLCVCVCV